MTAANKPAAIGRGALIEAQAAKEIEAEVSASFRAMMDMLSRDPDTASVRGRAAQQEGAQARLAIEAASADLERLGKIDGMNPAERELTQLV
jgi:hypothetical protein